MSGRAAIPDSLIEQMAAFRHDPLGHAIWCYPWGEPGPLQDVAGPRTWQRDLLAQIGTHLADPATRFQPLMMAVASGHGIGKSALVAMVIKWALDTMTDTRVVVTANTEAQLRSKTWPEVCKWQRLALTADLFAIEASTVRARDSAHRDTWRANLETWSRNNTEAFAGLHNRGRRIVLIMDEASAIDDKVWEVAEGAMTDAGTELIWLSFGNPTRASGRFRECFRKYRKRWQVRQIDSRTVEGAKLELFREWEEAYGPHSDFFRTRCLGQFPNVSAKQFIGQDLVDAAAGRYLRPEQYSIAAKVIACDPAWEGDDSLEIGMRQGLYYQHLLSIPKNGDDVHVAGLLARFEDEHKADAVFIHHISAAVRAGDDLCAEFHGLFHRMDRHIARTP